MEKLKIIIAIDSFKGSATSSEAAYALETGIREVCPDADIRRIPVADGGEGTMDALISSGRGRIVTVCVHDPLMRPVKANYGILSDHTAVIEMAQASGLTLLSREERNPLKTSSFGTGELIRDALSRGIRKIVLTIGGSATNDAGIGLLRALGFRFTDTHGRELAGKGEELGRIGQIDLSGVLPELEEATFEVLCDVTNPFYGPEGATMVFSRQKGATPEMRNQLEQGMIRFARLAEARTGIDMNDVKGSGAAGGMGGTAQLFLNAEMRSGAGFVLDRVGFDSVALDADLVITGEGKIDRQTLYGKVPMVVLERMKGKGIPVIAVCGRSEDEAELLDAGFRSILSLYDESLTEREMMEKTRTLRELQNRIAEYMKDHVK